MKDKHKWKLFNSRRLLFLTHTIPLKKGDIYIDPFDGERYEITEVKSVAPTALFDGGQASCWEVYGKNA